MAGSKHPKLWHKLLLAAGPVSGLAVGLLMPVQIQGANEAFPISFEMRVTVGLALWMAVWWMTEVVPMAITATFPLIVFGVFGVRTPWGLVSSYLHPLIFLFLGGFLLSIALQKWSLHVRFATVVIRIFGTGSRRLIGGFMLATAMLSMWISNTATTLMMLPIAASVLAASRSAAEADSHNFARCLFLAIAYSASIGGMASIIGTPPNTFVASYLRDTQGLDVGFASWMAFGLPCSMVFLGLCWLFLTFLRFRLSDSVQGSERALDGFATNPLGPAQWRTLFVFSSVALLWIGRPVIMELEILGQQPLFWLSDAWIAMLGAATLFLISSRAKQSPRLLAFADLRGVPWGTLILFGGGLALAAAINATGADQLLGLMISRFPIETTGLWIIVIVAIVVLLTEITSNIATTATLVPVLAASAGIFGLEQTTVIVATALAASCAFMLPVATPPNAIVYGSGYVKARDMATTGFTLNVIGVVLVTLVMTYWFDGF